MPVLQALKPTAATRSPALHCWRLGAKEALLANDGGVFSTTPHFAGYPAILVRLEEIGLDDLDEVIVEAWLARAPKRLVKAYLDSSPRGEVVGATLGNALYWWFTALMHWPWFLKPKAVQPSSLQSSLDAGPGGGGWGPQSGLKSKPGLDATCVWALPLAFIV